jgi:hypothetical protein
VWTPKRIVLLVFGIAAFVFSYLVYANRIGGIDGLPPLPKEYWPTKKPPVPPKPKGLSQTAQKLEEAFGKGCEEASFKRPIKIEVPARGMILSAGDFQIMPPEDGRVRLWPLSVALFGKARGEDGTPEINTIRGDEAFLTFERPIVTLQDIGRYRIIAAEIIRNIRIVNNHRTAGRDDDLSVYIINGPLFYSQKEQRVWTDDFVRLVDASSKPSPTVITGHGMVLDLITEEPTTAHARKKQQVDNITGVRTVRLLSTVDMSLYIDSGSGFLDSQKPADKKKPAPGRRARPGDKKPEPEKAHLAITTPGPFFYDLQKDFARFDVPNRGRHASLYPDQVMVTRTDAKTKKLDHLVCEHLELQFRKKDEPGKGGSRSADGPRNHPSPGTDRSNLQIETAHATGISVDLVSEAEHLEANGNDFTYDARTLLSILKGSPMKAIKEGNLLHARELRIRRFQDGRGQEATALGPGTLDLHDKSTEKTTPNADPDKITQHARWNDKLISSKDGDLDVIHLTGKASFIDDANGQELNAEDLKVWMMPREDKAAPQQGPALRGQESGKKAAEHSAEGKQPRPHHIVAQGNVTARSSEFNLRKAHRLVVWFKDAPPGAVPLAEARSGRQPVAEAPKTAPGTTPPVLVPSPSGPAAPKKPAKTAPPAGPVTIQKPGSEPRKPLNLWGRSVEAHVLRFAERSQLQELRSEGAVHVTQEPNDPKEKGVDIKGETLHLTAQAEGNLLTVTGDLARLDMQRMQIRGPVVNIDQPADKAWVDGIGSLTMESDTDLEGKKLNRTVPLTIYWNKSMYFNGTFAEFHGSIQGEQENSRLACQALQVFFDKPISLKESAREGERAKVDHLVCDKSARTEDITYEKGLPVKLQSLKAPAISADNTEGVVQAVGPGAVRLIQQGSDLVAEPEPASRSRDARSSRSGQEKKEGLKMTYVEYADRMLANKKSSVAYFYGSVRVFYKPVEDFEAARSEEIDLDRLFEKKLPEGSMFLRCEKLVARQRPAPQRPGPQEKTKAYQEMIATGRAEVFSQEIHGRAERITFDEEKDQIIFDGGETGKAILHKANKDPGRQPTKIVARKIIYERKTGKHTAYVVDSIEGDQ